MFKAMLADAGAIPASSISRQARNRPKKACRKMELFSKIYL